MKAILHQLPVKAKKTNRGRLLSSRLTEAQIPRYITLIQYARLLYILPVFPDVGSMRVHPGFKIPFSSAFSTMRRAILSLMLPPALKNSHLATRKKRVRLKINNRSI